METLHPGLFLQEIQSEAPVEGVSTATGAFVGIALKGPVGVATLVTSWNQFLETYGGYTNNSYLAYAVRGFFENGGARAYISRVVHYTAGVKTSIKATAFVKDTNASPVNAVSVDALYDGTYGNKLAVEVKAFNVTTKTMDFLVYDGTVVVETYKGIHITELDDIVNAQSKYVRLVVLNDTLTLANAKVTLLTGNDGLVGVVGTDYVDSLPQFNSVGINLLAIPGVTDVAVLAGATAYAENRADTMVIAEIPMSKTVAEASSYKLSEANVASERVALYYSWGKVADPIGVGKNPTKIVPPSGHIMGVYSRTDNERGVFKAPAGVDAVVRGFVGVEKIITDAEQDLLNPIGINCIRSFAGEGILLWGTRTTKTNSEFKYVPIRRSHDYIGQSILAGTRWSVFEPNNEDLWAKIHASVEDFLRGFWRAGGLKGADESQAFFVQVDSTTVTAEDIDAGRVYVNVGVAHQTPAEFVIFRLSVRN